MRYSQSDVAKQYAKAYLFEYGIFLELVDIQNMKAAVCFFKKRHNFMSLVTLVVTDDRKNNSMVNRVFTHFSLHYTLKNLVRILIQNKRFIIFPQILQDICCLYMIQNNILEITIQTAHPIDEIEKKKFEIFFTKLSGKQIVSRVEEKESLIAGVRIQSDLFLWEYSIEARLRKLRQRMLIEG